jgi:UDP-glucose 4-epimerase
MQSVLVVGGAGYIGSHTVHQLLKKNFKVVVVDDLSTGTRRALSSEVVFHQVDILNFQELKKIFESYKFNAVFHFAAKLSVPESFPKHFEYFDTNVVGTKNLLKLCEEFNVNRFVFSSTAAVYGNVQSALVKETDPLQPQNPYGLTKKMAEALVANQAVIQKNFKYRILRYFNVAGAEPDGSNGPRNLDSGQLILNLCKSSVADKVAKVFGTDYPTKDGTTIRDFIHVVDLAEAHIEAYKCLESDGQSGIWNCGYGQGYSVMEVIKAFETANNLKFDIRLEPPRQGDPAQVVANNETIFKESNWRPKYNDISVICKTTYEWIKSGIERA